MTSRPESAEAAPELPLLPGIFQVIPMARETFQLRSAGRVMRLSGTGLGAALPDLLAACDGRTTLAELSQRFSVDSDALARLVGRLHEQGVIQDGAAWVEAAEEGRNAAARDYVMELGVNPGEIAARIRSSRVLFVGLGPVGRLAAAHVVAAGTGEVMLSDGGRVRPRDRLLLPSAAATVGRPRTEVAAEECAVATVSPGQRCVMRPAHEAGVSIRALLDGVDLAVIEVDEAGARAEALNVACLNSGIPFLMHATTTFDATVGPSLAAPFDSGCHLCLVQRRLSHLRSYDERIAYQTSLRDGSTPEPEATPLGGCVSVVSGLVAAEALRLIGRFEPPATRGGVLRVDFRTLQVTRNPLQPIPGCAACG